MREAIAGALMVVMATMVFFFGWRMALSYVSDHAQTGIPVEIDGKFYKVINCKPEH